MDPDIRPAAAVLIGGVSGLLVADVVLMARDLAPLTASLRTRPGRVFVIALSGHVLDVLGPIDPFRAIAWSAGLLKRRLT